ncbi:hypothetical protein NA56DRAFT_677644 [Hyaloscypha hepaticicola]|uniref:Uncharacterized protein n=1 Tax=Hyaloscypha hepaticicola TaxID=2082293 RepID=A0A2J6QEE1_9HELO|nr:hypothetical protein NA56DRAFT_677644 [Hyaloscypha hepaticicola]
MATRTFLLTLALPATAALFLTSYLQSHPLSSQKTNTIHTFRSLSPSCLLSLSLRIINPHSHIAATDSRLITFSKRELGEMTDEEVLARCLRGFYAGWVFWPEKLLIFGLRSLGRKLVAVGFEGVDMDGPQIVDPLDLSREKLPEKGTVLLGGNFMVLDKYVKGGDWIGDNRKGFAGLHRFEVERIRDGERGGVQDGEEEEGGVQLWYSSISCHPTRNKLPLPAWMFGFHEFYAQCLFRDGVAEVLRK